MKTGESLHLRLMSLAVLLADSPETRGWAPAVRKVATQAVNEALMALDKTSSERSHFRDLLQEWHEGLYDGQDFLRRVKLALHIGKPVVSLASIRGIAKTKQPS